MIFVLVHYPWRELESKTLLAYKLSLEFGAAIIGNASEIRELYKQDKLGRESDQDNLFLEISANPESKNRFLLYRSKGAKIVTFCEEGTAFTNAKIYADNRLFHDSLRLIDGFVSWGAWHNTAIRLSSLPQGKIIHSGHPRFEIYQRQYRSIFSEERKEIQKTHGRFLFIISNLPWWAMSEQDTEEWIKLLDNKAINLGYSSLEDMGLDRSHYIELAKRRYQSFLQQLNFSDKLNSTINATEQNINIVVRPRFEVNLKKFKNLCRSLGFTGFIDNRWSVTPWIQSSEAVLHDECTTSIEASLSDKLAISLGNPRDTCPPVRDATKFVGCRDDAIEIITSVLNNNETSNISDDIEKSKEKLRNWFYNLNSSPSHFIADFIKSSELTNQLKYSCNAIVLQQYMPKVNLLDQIKTNMAATIKGNRIHHYKKIKKIIEVLNSQNKTDSKVRCIHLTSSVYLLCRDEK